jgi:hypothetical protein
MNWGTAMVADSDGSTPLAPEGQELLAKMEALMGRQQAPVNDPRIPVLTEVVREQVPEIPRLTEVVAEPQLAARVPARTPGPVSDQAALLTRLLREELEQALRATPGLDERPARLSGVVERVVAQTLERLDRATSR